MHVDFYETRLLELSQHFCSLSALQAKFFQSMCSVCCDESVQRAEYLLGNF